LARPVAMTISLLGSSLNWRERAVAGWFGPRGFASVFYALLVLNRGVPNAGELYHLAGVVIAASIVLHSSTDYTTARWIARHSPPAENV
jgi:NhaP-type Na+/H+ or K+/H+ antiporter